MEQNVLPIWDQHPHVKGFAAEQRYLGRASERGKSLVIPGVLDTGEDGDTEGTRVCCFASLDEW